MFCNNCGTEVKDGAKFCLVCGAKQEPGIRRGETIDTNASAPVLFADASSGRMFIPEASVADSMPVDPLPGVPGNQGLGGNDPRAQLPLYPQQPNLRQNGQHPPRSQSVYTQAIPGVPHPSYPAYGHPSSGQPGQYSDYPQSQHSHHMPEQIRMSGGRIAAIVIVVLLAAALLIGGIFFAISRLGYNLSHFDPPRYGDGNGNAENGYSDYETLIYDYFAMMEEGDSSSFADFLHPKVIEALDTEDIPQTEYAAALDDWIDFYGMEITNYDIGRGYPYENSDYTVLSDSIGLEQAELEQYIDVEVDVGILESGEREEYIMDFDLIKVSGQWYIVEVW